MYSIVSTFVVILIALGLYWRKQRKLHIPLMLSAFVIDLSLVAVIEFNRQAVEKVVDNVSHEPDAFLLFHAGISTLALVFYVLLIISGYKILKQGADCSCRKKHFIMAIIFVLLRMTNYITSFFV